MAETRTLSSPFKTVFREDNAEEEAWAAERLNCVTMWPRGDQRVPSALFQNANTPLPAAAQDTLGIGVLHSPLSVNEGVWCCKGKRGSLQELCCRGKEGGKARLSPHTHHTLWRAGRESPQCHQHPWAIYCWSLTTIGRGSEGRGQLRVKWRTQAT